MVKSFSVLLLLFLGVAVATAQTGTSYQTTLFGALDPDTSPTKRYSALTGYAAPDGSEYALLGGFTGTHIVDVTKSPLKQVAFIPGPASAWREMKTYGAYGYVVSEGGAGLQIIDLSKLPTSAALVRADTSVFVTAHTISQEGRYLYVHGSNVQAGANQGTLIFDVEADPTRPKLVGMWTGRYVHDATIRNDTMYAAAINDGQLDIVYLGKDRSDPKQITQIRYAGAGTHNADVSIDGRYIFTTDEVGATPKTLKIWDRSDISSIEKVADWTPVPGEIIHNVHIKGNLAFVAWYTAGTRIVDISDPRNPVQVGYYDTYPGSGTGFAGNWETYPYLPSGKILASDMQTGLHVFTFDGATSGSVFGTVRDSITGDPVAHATLVFPTLGMTIEVDSAGGYSFSGAVDTLDYLLSAQDYITRSGRLIVLYGGAETNLLLSPLPLVDLSLNVVDNVSGLALDSFAYRVVNRSAGEGVARHNPEVFVLPKDSLYSVMVGAWGYRSKIVPVSTQGTLTQIVRLDREYYDGAELDLGWSLESAGDNARSGRWERGTTVGTFLTGPKGRIYIQSDTDATGGIGDHAFITGLANSTAEIGANDVDDGVTTLTSPLLDLASYYDPYVSVALWYSRDGNPSAIDDTLRVLLSDDGGTIWTTLADITESSAQWVVHTFRVREFATPTARMLFRVVAADVGSPSLLEAGVDEFRIEERGDATDVDEVCDYTAGYGAHALLRPNPLSGQGSLHLNLQEPTPWGRLALYDMLGRRVLVLYEGAIGAGPTVYGINVSSLPAGRYFWRLERVGGMADHGGVVVER